VNALGRLWTLARNFGSVRHSLSTLSGLYAGEGMMQALGGLTDEEIDALADWAREADVVVEIGTLFGFTARELARRLPKARIVTVDNFSWNPFGLPARSHASFARSIMRQELESGRIELVVGDGLDYLARLPSGRVFVFLDGDHSYGAVKAEIAAARAGGAAWIAGHDYANARFGVTRAVQEAFGAPSATAGMCWLSPTAVGS